MYRETTSKSSGGKEANDIVVQDKETFGIGLACRKSEPNAINVGARPRPAGQRTLFPHFHDPSWHLKA